jgi:GNAT superfamily N-acetyltransferase
MNRAYRGSGPSHWSNEPRYLAGDRTTTDVLCADLAAKPAASHLKWVEEGKDPFIGCVWLEPLGEDTWYLGSLAIDPDWQRGGLGRVMLCAAEQWVRERGGKRVQMTVINVRDALISWYLRRGYHKTGDTLFHMEMIASARLCATTSALWCWRKIWPLRRGNERYRVTARASSRRTGALDRRVSPGSRSGPRDEDSIRTHYAQPLRPTPSCSAARRRWRGRQSRRLPRPGAATPA